MSVSLLSGKILEDDRPLSEYRIEEKNFVVIMIAKVTNTYYRTSYGCYGNYYQLLVMVAKVNTYC